MLEFILALLPIIWLVIALCVMKMQGYKACMIAVLVSAAVGILYFKLSLVNTATAALEGIMNALWPICAVIIAALFVYELTLETKAMDSIKAMLSGVSSNKMIVLLIIVWGFGNFMEGMAGFGTAVAIPAGILVAMGYDPIPTVIACLIVNSTPTAFGSVGVPTTTIAQVTGLNAMAVSGATAMLQFILTAIAPFVMIIIVGKGVKALKEVWPIALISSISFIVPQYIAAKFIGPELPNILGSVVCMICTVAAGIAYEKKHKSEDAEPSAAMKDLTLKKALVAWSPFILIFILLLFTSSIIPALHNPIAAVASKVSVYTGKNPNTLTFSWLDCPGVKIFIAGLIGGLIQRASIKRILGVFWKTFKANIKTIITICSVLATAKIMGYSGMISAMAAFLVAVTGTFYPAISPLIGMIGGFVTGSGTSTAVLFGKLQTDTAAAIHANPDLLAAANLMGAGIGKAISPQGIAIGCAASGLAGHESTVLSKVLKFAVVYVIVAGIVTYIIV
ncbi:MAG: L-lactate permease [Clostridiales bacterium]|jgi:lactate permease|nr:L-lactate permease [Clostridiales bacterium]